MFCLNILLSARCACRAHTQPLAAQKVYSWWQLVHKALLTMNSPLGHSRAYTITLTVAPALLISAIVWIPAIDSSTQHDHE
jgi:hypothetical protein